MHTTVNSVYPSFIAKDLQNLLQFLIYVEKVTFSSPASPAQLLQYIRIEKAELHPTVLGPFLHSSGTLLTAMKQICFPTGLGIRKPLGRWNEEEATPKAADAICTFPGPPHKHKAIACPEIVQNNNLLGLSKLSNCAENSSSIAL